MHDPHQRLSLKIPKKICNEATDQNLALPESEPEPEPETPRLSLKIPKKIWDVGFYRSISIPEPEPEPEPSKLSLKYQKNMGRLSG